MKTLADIKRRAQLGVKLVMTAHSYYPNGSLIGVPRAVKTVQGNAIQFEPVNGKSHGSWLFWPKAKYVRIDGPNAFTILPDEDGGPSMSYEFVVEPTQEQVDSDTFDGAHSGEVAGYDGDDFTYQDEGSIVILYAESAEAGQWVKEHLPADAQTWGRNGTMIERWFFPAILEGIHEAGLTIKERAELE